MKEKWKQIVYDGALNPNPLFILYMFNSHTNATILNANVRLLVSKIHLPPIDSSFSQGLTTMKSTRKSTCGTKRRSTLLRCSPPIAFPVCKSVHTAWANQISCALIQTQHQPRSLVNVTEVKVFLLNGKRERKRERDGL